MKEFKVPKKNWKSIPIDSAKFILNESKDYIEYTIGEAEKITNRAYSLLILLTTILSAIVGYTFNKILIVNFPKTVVYLNFYFTIIIAVFIVYLLRLVFPRSIKPKGRKPSELARIEFLDNKLNKTENYLAFILQEIENSQSKINFNLNKNKERRDKLKVIMVLIAFLFPVYLILAFAIINS